jgi:hypothetical protein
MGRNPTRNASASPGRDAPAYRLAPRAISKNRVHPYSKDHPGQTGGGAGWTIPDICEAYAWPKGLEGGGTIAIIHLGGGWNPADIDEFFKDQGLNGTQPHVSDHSVDGVTQNGPSDPPSQADLEVALDIQIAGASYAIATGQSASIRVYSAPQNPEGLIAAVRAATTDECDVCCITWGADEQTWGKAAADTFNAAAKAAVDNGMIIVAASGDNDSSDGGPLPRMSIFPRHPHTSSAAAVRSCSSLERPTTKRTWKVSGPNSARKSGTTIRSRRMAMGLEAAFPSCSRSQIGNSEPSKRECGWFQTSPPMPTRTPVTGSSSATSRT